MVSGDPGGPSNVPPGKDSRAKVFRWSTECTTGQGFARKAVLVVHRMYHRAKVMAKVMARPLQAPLKMLHLRVQSHAEAFVDGGDDAPFQFQDVIGRG